MEMGDSDESDEKPMNRVISHRKILWRMWNLQTFPIRVIID